MPAEATLDSWILGTDYLGGDVSYALSIAGRTLQNVSLWDERVRFKTNPVSIVSAHGGVSVSSKREFRPIRLSGELFFDSAVLLRDYLNNLVADFTEKMPGSLVRLNDNRHIPCLIEEFGYRFQALRIPETSAEFDIVAMIVDPFWYADAESSNEQNAIAASPHTWTIANNGLCSTPPRIEVTAVGADKANFRVTNTTSGETVFCGATVPSGKTAVFDTRAKTLRVAGVNKLTNLQGFFYDLKPGNNAMKYEGPTSVNVRSYWTERW